MNASYQNVSDQYVAGPSAGCVKPPPLLDTIKDRLAMLHKTTTELHDFADRIVGIREAVGPQKISVAPCGLLEEICESAGSLQDRLNGLYERLSRV